MRCSWSCGGSHYRIDASTWHTARVHGHDTLSSLSPKAGNINMCSHARGIIKTGGSCSRSGGRHAAGDTDIQCTHTHAVEGAGAVHVCACACARARLCVEAWGWK